MAESGSKPCYGIHISALKLNEDFPRAMNRTGSTARVQFCENESRHGREFAIARNRVNT